MTRQPSPLPSGLGTEFLRAEALARGVGEWRLRGADLERPFRGVRGISPAASRHGNDEQPSRQHIWADLQLRYARAYALMMPQRQFFHGVTGAIIWGLPVPTLRGIRATRSRFGASGELDVIDVGALTPARAPRRPGIAARHFAPSLVEITVREGLRVLDAPSLWATLGPMLELPDRVALADSIVRTPRIGGNLWPAQRGSYATIDELECAARVRRRIGRELLLEALPLVRDGAASAPESHLRLALVEAGLPEPALDHDVYSASGLYLGTSECAYPDYRLALEYEGDHHRVDTRQWDRDITKYQDYRNAGWDVIRVTSRMLYLRREELMCTVRDGLLRRGSRP